MNSSELLEDIKELRAKKQSAISKNDYQLAARIDRELRWFNMRYVEQEVNEAKEINRSVKSKMPAEIKEWKVCRNPSQNIHFGPGFMEKEMEAIHAEMAKQQSGTATIQRRTQDGHICTTVNGTLVFDSREEERKAIRETIGIRNSEDTANMAKITKRLQSPGCEICCPVCHPDIGSPDPHARHSHSSIRNCWHNCRIKYSQDGQKYWLDRMLSHVTLDFPETWGHGWGNVPPRVVDDSTAALAFLWNEPEMDVTTAMMKLHRSWRERHNPKPVKNTRSGVKEWIKEPISTATPIRFALSVGLLFIVIAFACLGFGALVALLVAVL